MSHVKSLGILDREELGEVRWNDSTSRLYEEIVRNREGRVAHMGAVVVRIGHEVERSAQDTYIAKTEDLTNKRWIGGEINQMPAEQFEKISARVQAYAHGKDLYVQDGVFGDRDNDPLPVRIVTETAWHALVARNTMWVDAKPTPFEPCFEILHLPGFHAVTEIDRTRRSSFVVVSPAQRVVLICGTEYGGEIRQALSTVCRFLLGEQTDALPLRCAVMEDTEGRLAAFFGRTGNGKTSLAASIKGRVIGDYDHLWTESGLHSAQRGCYARVANLESDTEPSLFDATRRFGTVLENVAMDHKTRRVDFGHQRTSVNARAIFPLSHLPRGDREGRTGHPNHVFLITRDTLGVLPPIARLTYEQATFSFLTSYVSSVGETELRPGDVRPSEASAKSWNAPLAVSPALYARRFGENVAKAGATCWFLNTGWSGEPSERSARVPLSLTQALVQAAIEGHLDEVPFEKDPLFLFDVPTECPGISPEELDPRKRAQAGGDYELRANRLALDFIEGFERFEGKMPESVRQMVAAVPISIEGLDVMDQLTFSM